MKIHLVTGQSWGVQAVCGTSKHFLPHLGVRWEERHRVECKKCQKVVAQMEERQTRKAARLNAGVGR